MTSSNGNISALLAICTGNSPVTGEFPTQRPVTRSFDAPDKRLSKQSWGWWFETPSCPLWHHCNDPTPCDWCNYWSIPWWRHQMETFSALLAICAENSPVPVNSPHKGQWREALMFTLICARINGWVNNREAGDFRRYRAHYDVIVMHTGIKPIPG